MRWEGWAFERATAIRVWPQSRKWTSRLGSTVATRATKTSPSVGKVTRYIPALPALTGGTATTATSTAD